MVFVKSLFLKQTNQVVNQIVNFILAIDNNVPDLSSRTNDISLEVNEIETIVHDAQSPINRTGKIPFPAQVDVNVTSVGRKH